MAATVLDDLRPTDIRDADHVQLVAAYKAILRERVIRHPVPYHFVRELGKGRQGIVFLAVRQGGRGCLTRHAVKLHDPAIYSSADKYWTDMGRIANQVSKLQPIHCDNLVSREAYDECRGIGYIQMAAIDGVDLQYLLEGTHLAIARGQSSDEEWDHFMKVLFRIENERFMFQPGVALYIMRKILIGLHIMHESGFLHADVKPSNAMIDRQGSIKLVDFGRAVVVGEPINILLGSPLYMAPETHRLEPGTPQSDIFGAGLVGIEMLGGRPMADYADLSEKELLEFKLSMASRLESLLPPHLAQNKTLVKALRRFVMPNPDDRYASAEEAEISYQGLRGVHRKMAMLSTDAEYDREFERYLDKLTDPVTGHLNPRLG